MTGIVTAPGAGWSEYGDASMWRAVARANAIDDPLRLISGRTLLLPASEELIDAG